MTKTLKNSKRKNMIAKNPHIKNEEKKSTKAPKTAATEPAKATQAPPRAPRPVEHSEITGLPYRPELRDWRTTSSPVEPAYVNSHTFALLDTNDLLHHGAKIATIIIEPDLAPESARHIAELIQCAPKLFRALRESNRWLVLNDIEHVQEFADNMKLLWEACGHVPYAAPEVDEDDELSLEWNKRTVAILKARKSTAAKPEPRPRPGEPVEPGQLYHSEQASEADFAEAMHKTVSPRPADEPAPEPRSLHPDFERVEVETAEGDEYSVVLPKKRTPVLARPGMPISVTNEGNGIILQVLKDWCVYEDEDGEEKAVKWGEIGLENVKPDPAFIDAPAAAANVQSQHSASVVANEGMQCVVRPGMRVEIDTNDGNQEQEGVVVQATPEYCVVQLDEKTKNSFSWHVACDWGRVTVKGLTGPRS